MDYSSSGGTEGGGDKSHTGRILSISFVFFLLIFVFVGGLYLLWSRLTSSTSSTDGTNGDHLVQPYNKQFLFEVYTLLPNFQNGQYESRVVVNGQTYPPVTSPGLRWSSSAKSVITPVGDVNFPYLLAEGQGIQYTIYDILTQTVILTASYAINSNDMQSAGIIYLCDGTIVSDLMFIPNFQYRFDGSWNSESCEGQNYTLLSWKPSSTLTSGVFVTDDQIPCPIGSPTANTTPFTYNSTGITPNSVGWKGAWVGMTWYVNLGSTGGTGIGSIKVNDPSTPILVIAPGSLVMSSS